MAGSKCGKGVGVAHIELDDGREHRDAQAGEGVVASNLRGGNPRRRWARLSKAPEAHRRARARGAGSNANMAGAGEAIFLYIDSYT
eukprot:scaffold26604_cov116-Isochrysis_galbana.AAC.1